MRKINFILIIVALTVSCQKINKEKEFEGQWLKVDHTINGQPLPAFLINTNYILSLNENGLYTINNQILPWHGYPICSNSDNGTWKYDSKKDQITFTTSKIDTVNLSSPLSQLLVTSIESNSENAFSMNFTDQSGQTVIMVFEKL